MGDTDPPINSWTESSYAEAKKSIADFKSNPTVPQTVESLQDTIEVQGREILALCERLDKRDKQITHLKDCMNKARRALG